MAQRILYLVRHGQYVLDEDDAAYGTLTGLGRRQSRRVGKRLRTRPIVTLHHSDLPRAVQTAAIIAKSLSEVPLRPSRLLREGNPGVRGRRRRPRQVAARDRMDKVFERYFRPCRGRDRHEVIVCHGNLIRYLLMRTLEVATGNWWNIDTIHCALCIVRVLPDRRRVHAVNDVGHLPFDMRTAQ